MRVDASGATIGKRYSRNDELGTPYGCTIDFACECVRWLLRDLQNSQLNSSISFPPAVSNGTMTLRERDSTEQLIGKIDDVVAVVADLCNSRMNWEEACQKLERYSGVQEIE